MSESTGISGKIESDRSSVRVCSKRTVKLRDGTELFYRVWSPVNGDEKCDRAVVLFHRGHEHSGRFEDVIDELGVDDCLVFAWDSRGHGKSPGERGVAESVACLAHDADEFVGKMSEDYGVPIENMAVVAHSIGAVVVAAWVHDYAPPIRAMVLITPAFRVKLYVPLAIPGLRLLHKVRPRSMVKSYVRPSMLTHDKDAAQAYADDELISPGVSVQLLLDLHDTSTRLLDDAGAITIPAMVLVAGSDWVVHTRAQEEFFDKLSSSHKVVHKFPGMYHDILHEKGREQPLAEIRGFLRERLATSLPEAELEDSDKRGPSFDKWKQISSPLPLYHPKRWNFALTRLVIGTVGQLSDGMRLGWNSGFNSGRMLDYIYADRAKGITPVGTLADRIYLSSPGWSGVRIRRMHLNQLLDAAISRIASRDRGRPVQILDVAAGAGRYVLDALARNSEVEIRALLCDRDEDALDQGREIAAGAGLENRVEFRRFEAFDRKAVSGVLPQPDIAIVSGLFELFPDNVCVMKTLRGLAACMTEGGFLIYTNQPWHPQQEMIGRSLHGYDRERWVMRCRSSAEIDHLANMAGFKKQKMLIDDKGIFTVTLAQREPEVKAQ
ncbi:MAG: bifunctional alpha/beta hydrolase/class I SAM-dependent methyltransferase [Planctomycetota bacterium]